MAHGILPENIPKWLRKSILESGFGLYCCSSYAVGQIVQPLKVALSSSVRYGHMDINLIEYLSNGRMLIKY